MSGEARERELDLLNALGCLVAASGHLLHAKDRWATLRQGISFPLSRWGDADLSDNIRIGRQWLVNAREMSARAEAGKEEWMETTRVTKPDAQAFDEVRIRTVPRYKTSGLSGDEWRISAVVEFWRKGVLVHEAGGYRNVETAIGFLYADYHRAIDDGKACFEGDRCDQEGCADLATVTYRVKEEFSRDRPHEWHGPARGLGDKIPVRKFCARHSRRGDCGFDDSDANYELIDGNVAQPLAADVRESAQVVVELNSMEDLPAAIRSVKDKLEGK